MLTLNINRRLRSDEDSYSMTEDGLYIDNLNNLVFVKDGISQVWGMPAQLEEHITAVVPDLAEVNDSKLSEDKLFLLQVMAIAQDPTLIEKV